MTALPRPEDKAAAVRRMFDRISPRYDKVNRLLTFGGDQRARRWLVHRLQIGPGDTVLDLCCGTGDLAALCMHTGAPVFALDFSRGMLRRARERLATGVHLLQADALHIPLADGSVAAAVSGFALRNLVAIPPAFAELARVLRPGGRLGLIEVAQPGNRALRLGHGLYFNRVVPAVGALLSDRQAYRYLPASAAYLPPPLELARMLRDAGFRRIRRRTHLLGAIQSITAIRA